MTQKQENSVSSTCPEEIDKLKEEFKNAGHQIKPGDHVRSDFADGNDHEFMWVKVLQKFNDGTIHGTLSNDPILMIHLKNGTLVAINENECLGYIAKDE